MRTTSLGLAVCAVAACVCAGCSRPSPQSAGQNRSPDVRPTENADAPPPPNPPTEPAVTKPPGHVDIDVPDPAEARRWLQVVEVRKNVPGGWTIGDFDPKKNKIMIETHGVAEFSIETDLMPIDWSRGVVLRIDGFSSQLRRRKYSQIHFHVTPTGGWEVVER